MAFWGELGLQTASNSLIECIIYFHDYIMIILRIILIFVTYFIIFNRCSKYLNKILLEAHFLEFIWTIVPLLILLFIAYPSLIMLYFIEYSEFSNYRFNIKVIAHQWYWEYSSPKQARFDRYINNFPTHFYTLERTESLILPINRNIQIYVTSADVLHSFTVPRFGIKVDAIPGRLNILNFNVNTPGTYFGQCSEICGSNHRFIPIQVIVY